MDKQSVPTDAEGLAGSGSSTAIAQAVCEAEQCLQCEDPVCVGGCPLAVPIPDFMNAIALGDMQGAARILRSANPLPAICGRICEQEEHCESSCHLSKRLMPVSIGHLFRFVADWERGQPASRATSKPWRSRRVAVIGSGTAGLVCAGELARLGYPVTVYEGLHEPGGLLRYGIPEQNFPKEILDWEIDLLKRHGVEIICNVIVGQDMKMEDLIDKMGFSAVFIATATGRPHYLGIPGENLNGVFSAKEFLTRINLRQSSAYSEDDAPMQGKRVAVIGADQTAMEVIRSALRMGAEEGHVIYQRSEKEMPASSEEYRHACEEGVKFHWLTSPIEILGDEDGWIDGLRCIRTEPGEPDASGKAKLIPVEDSEYVLSTNSIVLSFERTDNPLQVNAGSDLEAKMKGDHIVEKGKDTASQAGLGGAVDAATGTDSVITAAGAGKNGAAAIHKELCRDDDWLEVQRSKGWDDFMEWCQQMENGPHE